jgi:hypothetical protein
MAKIKSALEIALEKSTKLKKLTLEEKEKINAEKKIKSLLAKFFKGRLSTNELWQNLKGEKLIVLKKAQSILINSLSIKISSYEFKSRKNAILAIETLKEVKNTSTIELMLNEIIFLRKDYKKKKEEAKNILEKKIEKDPQARLKTVKQGQGMAIMQLSVEEALNENPQWKKFVKRHEKEYSQKFVNIIEKLKQETK